MLSRAVPASQAGPPGRAGLSAHGTELSQPSSAYLSLASCGPRCVQQPETRSAPDARVYFHSQYLYSHMNHWARRAGPGGQRAAAAHCSLGPAFSEVLPGPHTDALPAQETREPSQPPPQPGTGPFWFPEGVGGWSNCVTILGWRAWCLGDRDPAFSLSAPLPWRLSCFSSGPAPPGLQGAPKKLASLYLGTPDCGPHKWHNPIVQMGKLRHSEQVPWAQGSLGGSSSEWSKHLGLWGNKLACGCPRGWGVVRGAGCLGVFVPRGLGQAGRCSSRRGPVGPWAAAPASARPHPGGSHGSGWGDGGLVSRFCTVGGLPSWPAVVAVRLRPELPGPGGQLWGI